MSVIWRWLILFVLMMASAFALGYFLDPLTSPRDSLALILYVFVWSPCITYLGAREEHSEPIRRAVRLAREGRQGA